MKRFLGGSVFLLAGALIGAASAVISTQALGISPARPGSPWQQRDVSSSTLAQPYTVAHYLLDGRLPPPMGQIVEYAATTDSDGNRIDSDCDYVLTLDPGPRPRWWSLTARGGGRDDGDGHGLLASGAVVATGDGRIEITVSARPQPGNWIKAPGSRNYRLLYSAAEGSGALAGRPLQLSLFTIKRGGC